MHFKPFFRVLCTKVVCMTTNEGLALVVYVKPFMGLTFNCANL